MDLKINNYYTFIFKEDDDEESYIIGKVIGITENKLTIINEYGQEEDIELSWLKNIISLTLETLVNRMNDVQVNEINVAIENYNFLNQIYKELFNGEKV